MSLFTLSFDSDYSEEEEEEEGEEPPPPIAATEEIMEEDTCHKISGDVDVEEVLDVPTSNSRTLHLTRERFSKVKAKQVFTITDEGGFEMSAKCKSFRKSRYYIAEGRSIHIRDGGILGVIEAKNDYTVFSLKVGENVVLKALVSAYGRMEPRRLSFAILDQSGNTTLMLKSRVPKLSHLNSWYLPFNHKKVVTSKRNCILDTSDAPNAMFFRKVGTGRMDIDVSISLGNLLIFAIAIIVHISRV